MVWCLRHTQGQVTTRLKILVGYLVVSIDQICDGYKDLKLDIRGVMMKLYLHGHCTDMSYGRNGTLKYSMHN